MRVKAGVLVAALSLLAAAVPLLAHHSFAAEYDANKPITITGTVTKLEWMNPHARFYVDVKEADGRVTQLEFRARRHSRAAEAGLEKGFPEGGRSGHGRGLAGRRTAPRPRTRGA